MRSQLLRLNCSATKILKNVFILFSIRIEILQNILVVFSQKKKLYSLGIYRA